jgi:hypothetical protein
MECDRDMCLAFIGMQVSYCNRNRQEIWIILQRANISIVLMEKIDVCDSCEYGVVIEVKEI